ncbi:hypothetical protein FRZ03_28195 [Streptomyces misionensis]|uniref:Uncharacterized protein n=1 Tax=Streptomyces misionensis TaxID=67331 RepID=A0A5C6J0J2_9ACTN|nr:hypothetical protein [Streptomyces misionensis]TWV34744.1 hypothetical protein FRZ03_28195 [Streptomyces misionensis]
MKSIKRSAGIAASLISVLEATAIAAPAASATPTGCGELDNGQLCITGGKVGVNAGDCIRGVMEYKGTTYVTKWRCP